MTIRPTLILSLTLAAAVAAGLVGYDRVRPAVRPSAKAPMETASIQTTKTAATLPPARVVAPAAPEPEPRARMTASQQAKFDAWIIKTYLACWKPAAAPADADPYVAKVRLAFKPDGSLMKPPKLVNPPSDPAQKPQAKSVIEAVRTCDPLPVPAQYRPFYEQWKTKTIHFDPQVAVR